MTGADGATRTSSPREVALGLLLACHPMPCLAVTAFATVYAAAIGAGAWRLAGIAAAILSGQLVVGWSNDAIDAPRDLIAGRQDKPVSAGLVSRRVVLLAIGPAAIACLLLSLRLGAAAGLLHLIAVAVAVSYNTGLKSTVLSPLPYLISFGLLPVLLTFAVTHHGGTPIAHVAAAALLGVGAHFGNTVGDREADAATGVRGLPQRLGPQRAMIVMALLVGLAAAVLLVTVIRGDQGPGEGRRVIAGVLLAGGVVLASIGAMRKVGVPGGKAAWRLTLMAVSLVIAGFIAAV